MVRVRLRAIVRVRGRRGLGVAVDLGDKALEDLTLTLTLTLTLAMRPSKT